MRRERATSLLIAFLSAVSGLTPCASAQRGKAETDWQKRTVVIDYGVVRVGNHSLDELEVGSTWRIGNNNATTLVTQMPMFSGDEVVAPGSYRINLARLAEEDLRLNVEGSGYGLNTKSDQVYFSGKLSDLPKANEALELQWSDDKPDKPLDKQLKPVKLQVRFGKVQLSVPCVLVGFKSVKVKGWDVESFTLPASMLQSRLDARKVTPIATLTKKGKAEKDAPPFWNLLLSETEAVLHPAQVAPTDSFGFGAIVPPNAAMTFKGKVEWTEAAKETPYCEVTSVEWDPDRKPHVTLVCGKRIATVILEGPRP